MPLRAGCRYTPRHHQQAVGKGRTGIASSARMMQTLLLPLQLRELKVSGTFFGVRRSVEIMVVIPRQIGGPFLDYAGKGQKPFAQVLGILGTPYSIRDGNYIRRPENPPSRESPPRN